MVARFEVYLTALDPTQGREMNKTRPCVIVSPKIINSTMGTFIACPMTTASKPLPFRVQTTFQNKVGYICPDQIRIVDRSRLIKKLGMINEKTQQALTFTLHEMFA